MISQPSNVFARAARDATATTLWLAVTLFALPSAIAATSPATALQPAKAARPLPSAAAGPIDFPTIVERYGPAVVNIGAAPADTDQQASGPSLDAIATDDPILAYFKRVTQQSQDAQPGSPRVTWGSGSGFIVSPDGIVLTTAHVVNRAEEVSVRLTDRREFKAKVVATDPQTDVAVLQIEGATKLPVVKLGDSSRVRVGEQLLAIGAPDSPDNTVSAGLVSAMPRMLADGTPFPFLQTEIAVNPDNSGGPLFNRAGEVVGIDVQVYSDSERYQTVTFAIPINAALAFRRQLQGAGKASHGSLGIEVQDVDPGLAIAFGLPRPGGALVTSVAPVQSSPNSHGAANGAGLKPGDVITQINGKTIDRSAELLDYAANLPAGTKATLRIVRSKRPMIITIAIGTSDEIPAARPGPVGGGGAEKLGLTVHALTDAERRATGNSAGLMVDGTAGPAASAGIQPGDLLLSVNGTPVTSREELGTLIEKAGRDVALLIQRDSVRSFISVEVK
ncbi:trypsin-like peptidase domain-containing protein [Trinickia sp. EG282A]|uniref:trypsin-like peptidase domain-containing protein n=1 Tax=Trinickia sp. EG282A TaxID=3237013 RepID=UPI0034D1B478